MHVLELARGIALRLWHVPAAVDHANVGLIEMAGEPLRRDDGRQVHGLQMVIEAFTQRNRLSAASMSDSDSVGWAWMVSARSSASNAVSIASAPSAISSPAPGPVMPTPRIRPDSGSASSFVTPSDRPSVVARPD